eukprot:12713611-Alexandrium_andersonii.AAC.1
MREAPASVRSGNLGALAVLQQHSAPSGALNRIAQEYALGDAVEAYHLLQLRCIPGISNILADALPQ